MGKARELIDILDDYKIYEMANLRPETTGLPMVIWIQERSGKERHGPRIKVSKTHGDRMSIDNTVSVTIEDNPKVISDELNKKDLKIVIKFILYNKKVLLNYWNHKIDIAGFLRGLKRI